MAGKFPARSDGSDSTKPPTHPPVVRNRWPEIDDGVPPSSAMEVAAVDRSAATAVPKCHDNLYQLVVAVSLKAMLAPAPLTDGKTPGRLMARPPGASDH